MDMDASIDQVIQGLGSDAFDGSKYDLDCNDGQPTSGALEYDVEDTSLSSPKIIEMVSRTQPEPNPNPSPSPSPSTSTSTSPSTSPSTRARAPEP